MRLIALIVFGFLLSGCGGGGGGGSNTGTFSLAITDASHNDYQEALLEVSSITLIGAGGQETEMLDSPQTIDLLKLRNVSELLLRKTLTARSISKIRLEIDSITLNKVDMAGMITDSVSPPVPTRKVDLNPQGPLEIRAGEDLLVTLDVDVEKSIKINGTGASAQIRFRPVVFVTAGVSGLARLYGTYNNDGTSSSICELYRVSDADPDGMYKMLDICIDLDETNATYFDMYGEPLVPGDPASSGDLSDGDRVSVYGFYQTSASGESLAVEIIARGTGTRGGAFTTVNGVIPLNGGWDDASRRFTLALTENTSIPVELSEGGKVFDLTTDPVSLTNPTVLIANVRTEARGALTDSGSTDDPDWIQAFVAFTGEEENPEDPVDTLSGTIAMEGVDAATGVISLEELNTITGTGGACITTTATTVFYSIESGGDVTESSSIGLTDLADGNYVDASGDYVGECLRATTVIRETEPPAS